MKNLKAIRTSKGISQAELSRRTGIRRQNLCDFEKGRTGGTIETALKIAKALNVGLDELCGEEITTQPKTNIEQPKTNIEKIKSLNIRKMAEFLCEGIFCPYEICIQRKETKLQCSCKNCIMKWLQLEVAQ